MIRGDLRHPNSRRCADGMDVIFHLAADHGGRGYVDLHQYACSTNLGLDSILFRSAIDAEVEQVVYASSGCIYPLYLQVDPGETLYLTEDMEKAPGTTRMACTAWRRWPQSPCSVPMHDEHGMKTASCRYFTVYGPRGVENHAVIAMSPWAFLRQDPFFVWGTGAQIRNWTYVDDIVEGTIRSAQSYRGWHGRQPGHDGTRQGHRRRSQWCASSRVTSRRS